MMNNYAIVESGIVTNIVVWNGDAAIWSPPEGAQAVLVEPGILVDIGYAYDGTAFEVPSR